MTSNRRRPLPAEHKEDTDLLLEKLQKHVQNICYEEPASTVEYRLAKAICMLIAILRDKRGQGSGK